MNIRLHMFLAVTLAHASLIPCEIKFTNDSDGKVLIFDMECNQATEIAKGKAKKIGDPHKHAHCYIFSREPKKRGYTLNYELQMVACAPKGHKAEISVTELAQQHVPDIFTLKTHNQAKASITPPTQPSKKSSGCSACQKRAQLKR